jgi:uncharacterized protein (TIGR02594 family)
LIQRFKNSIKPKQPEEFPWIMEGKTVFGLHETRDNAKLRQWLISDGKTLGNPAALPWCADYVETAIKNSLPNEPFVGVLAQNPYWARNWLHFGVETEPVYGAIIVFARDKGGHVGFVVGEDASDYYVLGGNQSNAVTITRISKSRYLGARWPSSYANPKQPLPVMTPGNIPRTTNEF